MYVIDRWSGLTGPVEGRQVQKHHSQRLVVLCQFEYIQLDPLRCEYFIISILVLGALYVRSMSA
jgi:hypothetical protein